MKTISCQDENESTLIILRLQARLQHADPPFFRCGTHVHLDVYESAWIHYGRSSFEQESMALVSASPFDWVDYGAI